MEFGYSNTHTHTNAHIHTHTHTHTLFINHCKAIYWISLMPMPQLYMKDLYQAFSLNSKTSICTTAGSKVMAPKPRIRP